LLNFSTRQENGVDVAPMRTLDDKPELSHMPLGAHETMHHGFVALLEAASSSVGSLK
jgi:hypothetical protein